MKKMKKLMALLMTVAMVMGMAMTTMAAGTGKITISGTGIDGNQTAKYVQVVKENRQSTLGWQFNADIADEFVNGWNTVAEPDLDENGVISALIELGKLENTNNVNVNTGVINGDAAFGAALAAVKDFAKVPFDNNDSTTVLDGKGLYVIKVENEGYTFLPMAAYINTAMDDVNVQAKASKDQIEKTVAETGESVAPGDEVNYTIKEQYLYYAPNTTNKTFTITDKLTNGTFKKDSVNIALYNGETKVKDLEKDTDYTITSYADQTTFTVDFGAKYNANYAGKTVVITYTAIAGEVTTEAPLSNAVNSSNGTGKIVEVKPVSFKVIKKDLEEQKPLSDAEFTIYKGVNEGTANAVQLTLENKDKVWGVALGSPIKTDSNGEATIDNLDAQGTYYVKETKAPEGYSLNDTAYLLEGAIKENDTTRTETKDDVTYTIVTHNFKNFTDQTVNDTKLSSLPSTGGIGTTIFTIGGCVIMIVAAGLFFSSRGKENQ